MGFNSAFKGLKNEFIIFMMMFVAVSYVQSIGICNLFSKTSYNIMDFSIPILAFGFPESKIYLFLLVLCTISWNLL